MSDRLIQVFEGRSRWSPELRRQFADGWAAVRGYRDLRELKHGHASAVVTILELRAGAAGCLLYLGKRLEQIRPTPVVVLLEADQADLEWPLRELGATSVRLDEQDGNRLARICRKLMP